MGALELITLAVKVIQLGELALQGVAGAEAAFTAGSAKVKELVASRRNPTEAEYAEMHAKIDAQLAELQQLAAT